MKALKCGVDTAKQRRPYNSLGGHQTDPSKSPPSSSPQGRRARYLCTKSSNNRHDGLQAYRYINHQRYAILNKVNDRQDHKKAKHRNHKPSDKIGGPHILITTG